MKKLIENIKNFINKYKKQLNNIGIISLIAILVTFIFVLCYYPFNTKNNNEYNPLYVQTCVHILKYNIYKFL